MPNPTLKTTRNGQGVTYTWIRADELSAYAPITQCYGICFDADGDILVARKPGQDWSLSGGTCEPGETLEETLRREFLEEVNIRIKNVRPLGVQRVDFPGNLNPKEGEVFYQARFVCEVGEMLPQKPDPDTGLTWERQFVPAAKVTEYVKWGATGNAIFADAIEKFRH